MTRQVSVAILWLTGVAMAMFVMDILRNHNLDYWYLPYNLILAALPLGLAWVARRTARPKLTWRVVLLTLLWLLFLPNSFYIITDFVHVTEANRANIVQDIVMLVQFSLAGMAMGFTSLVMMQRVWVRYIAARLVVLATGVVLVMCGFAMYLGRELRWNSWDIATKPLAVITDINAIIVQPLRNQEAWWITASFVAMLGSLYLLVRLVAGRVKRAGAKDF